MLVQVLESKRAPLFARSKELGPFEHAVLETLGGEVVVPQLRGAQLVASTCLGANGDEERALAAAGLGHGLTSAAAPAA